MVLSIRFQEDVLSIWTRGGPQHSDRLREVSQLQRRSTGGGGSMCVSAPMPVPLLVLVPLPLPVCVSMCVRVCVRLLCLCVCVLFRGVAGAHPLNHGLASWPGWAGPSFAAQARPARRLRVQAAYKGVTQPQRQHSHTE